MNKPTIGLLTTLYQFSSSYSLCSVIQSQLVALVKNGYKTVLFVHDNFEDSSKVPAGVEVRKIVPRFLLVDYSAHQDVAEDLKEQATKAYEAFKKHTKDIDIIIEHDLIFQGWFLPYCMAIHKLAEETDIKWLHWIHSVPSPRIDCKYPHNLRYTLPKNSKLVYLNNFHVIRAAEAYGTFPKDVRVVYNPVDPRLFWDLHPLVEQLIDKYDLLSADIIQTYPLSTPRMVTGKGLNTVIDIFAKLKGQGKNIRLIVCNAHANDRREKQLIAETISYASQKGLNQTELIFSSLENVPKYEHGVPREVVSQLFQLSSLFIFPSISENCSLILLEAMLSGNLLVLNESVGSMREFGKGNALYFKFGGVDEQMNYDDRERFMEDVAKIINSELTVNKSIKVANQIKQRFNYDYVFKNMLEPLFYES